MPPRRGKGRCPVSARIGFSGPFEAGWHYGASLGRGLSANEADNVLAYLRMESTVNSLILFCNGSEDGASGDQFRLERTGAK